MESCVDKGTIWQLRNLVNRTSVTKDPSKCVKACEDFLQHVLVAYVVHATTKVRPALTSASRSPSVKEVAEVIVSSFTNLSTNSSSTTSDDLVQAYSKEVLTLGLLWMGFKDATKEGDGDRVIRYWRFFLFLFKALRKQNYAREAARILLSDRLWSPRLQEQLRFSRFVNTQGRPGCNIPLDLHMEHLNRVVKGALTHTGSSLTEKSIKRAGCSVGVVAKLCSSLVEGPSELHRPYTFQHDLHIMLECLDEVEPFACLPNRCHSSFSFNKSLLQTVNKKELLAWLEQQQYLFSCNL